MAFKKWQKLAEQSYKRPRKLKDVIVYWTDNNAPTFYDLIEAYTWEVMPSSHKLADEVFNMLWSNPNEYESALITLLCERLQNESASFEVWNPYTRFPICAIAKHIYENYGDRTLFEKYFENYETWDNSTKDRNYLNAIINRDVQQCIYSNRYKWGNLFKSCVLEFNPLWNVDGTESTVRTLEQDGTETRTKTGTETTAKTGTETNKKTGGVDDTLSDDYFEELDGSDAVAHTGTETTAYTGSEIDTLSGSDSTTQTGTIMHGTQKTTTESATFYDTEKVTDTYNTPTTTLYGKSDTKAFNNRSDTVTDNKTDTTTYGKKMTSSHTIDKDITYNVTDTLTHNTEDELTHNTSDALLRDLLDTERITKERHGNIGVTTTTSLLQEFREYVDFNIMDVIAKDIVNSITEGVY